MSELHFKALGQDGACCHGGSGRWNTNGEWMPTIHGNLAPCTRGYHLCRAHDLIEWIGPVIWIAEGQGRSFVSPQYLIFQEARVVRSLPAWTPVVARRFAAECAQRVLPIVEERLPAETLPRQTIEAAWEFADGSLAFPRLAEPAQRAWQLARQLDGAARDAVIAAYGAVVWEADGMAAWAAAGSARSAAAAIVREKTMQEAKANNLHPREAEKKADSAAAAALRAEREWQSGRLFALLGDLEAE
ncbi:MAG: hypothetical protein HQM03_13020 [Magnetococcales bacterium]|nr:hypothetical protein [Magnetococcales bacterium]